MSELIPFSLDNLGKVTLPMLEVSNKFVKDQLTTTKNCTTKDPSVEMKTVIYKKEMQP